jgi:hypothetical protein
MPISNPGLSLAIPALFGAIKPGLANLLRLGATDFSDEAPGSDIKPGTTIKYPISSISAAAAYDEATNNYGTGGGTDWASMTATHYLKGFDLKGADIDSGVDATRIEQLFSMRAGKGITAACSLATRDALDSVTTSSAVLLPVAPTMQNYLDLGTQLAWLDRAASVLAVSGPELAKIKSVFYSAGVQGDETDLAKMIGFADLVPVPGLAARALIVPDSALGYISRVPKIIARYASAGVETDPDTGFSIGIVVADKQDTNKVIVNADLWFGTAVLSAPAGATIAGIVKVGTTT